MGRPNQTDPPAMRALIVSTFAALIVMSVFARVVIRDEERAPTGVIDAYFAIADEPRHERVRELLDGFHAHLERRGMRDVECLTQVASLPPASASAYRDAFIAYHRTTGEPPLNETPVLVWSTDANPAREVQMALFREWHLRQFGTPADIVTDPSNRELTKSIVQSVAGAGPDIIEYIAAPELKSLVRAGIALDITDDAEQHGFGADTVFPAARSSITVTDDSGRLRQYAYPCNVGYTILMYHKDLFAAAGIDPPTLGDTIDDIRAKGEAVLAAEALPARPLFAVMNFDPLNTALSAGGRLFSPRGATHAVFDSPETVAGLRAFYDLMYTHRAMPRPAEAASMSTSTAGGFGGDVSGSAPGLFAQKSIAMYVGGRWEYVIFAIANRDRVIVPAIDRRLEATTLPTTERERLRSARASLVRDVLVPIPDDEYAAVERCLTEDDRARLLHIGVTHIPTTTGVPMYPTSARGAVVNRALERDAPERLVYALRFLRFLGSEVYNEQINGAFDSISGRVDACVDHNGISAAPRALPGLEDFDSPVFAEAMLDYAQEWELSPYIGRTRLITILDEVLERLQAGAISPEDAARLAEEAVNRQIIANVRADDRLRDRWQRDTGGVRPADIDPGRTDPSGQPIPIKQQIEQAAQPTHATREPTAAGGDA